MELDAGGPIADLLATALPEEAAIRSRWQHDAVPPWRRVEPTMVCEVRVTNLDLLVAGIGEFRQSRTIECHSLSAPESRSPLRTPIRVACHDGGLHSYARLPWQQARVRLS